MRQGCCPEEVPGSRGRGWVPEYAGGATQEGAGPGTPTPISCQSLEARRSALLSSSLG